MNEMQKIPFKVDIRRMLDLLARQIYQDPLALLRENCQNAFDAVLQRRALGRPFDPRIDVTIERTRIVVSDNGIGMTLSELNNNFWTAGASGKNTPEARAAGVVGTFGIGAMANFGIADALEVSTQSAQEGERLISSVRRDSLSATEDCIEIRRVEPSFPGTSVIATIPEANAVDVSRAESYIAEFVKFLDIPVYINGTLRSQLSFLSALPAPDGGQLTNSVGVVLSPNLTAAVQLSCSNNGDVWLSLTGIHYAGNSIDGEVLLKQGVAQLRTFRSKFALASTAVASSYNFGGYINLLNLQPTAGREALTTDSIQFMQTLISSVDTYVSNQLSATRFSDLNTGFMNWVIQHGKYDLCGNVTLVLLPTEDQLLLSEIKLRSEASPINYYEGSDPEMRSIYATEETPLIVPSSNNPRRQCQISYIKAYCKISQVSDAPQIRSEKNDKEMTLAETAFVFRVSNILEDDYFVKALVRLGKMTHDLPILIDTSAGLKIVFDSDGGSVRTIIELYNREFSAFNSMIKDFVRSVLFPKISNLVPSSTRQGAEAFLNAVRRPREYFEYELAEADALRAILGDYISGRLSFREAAVQAAERAQVNYQVVDSTQTGAASTVIPDVVDNARRLDAGDNEMGPLPAITRMEVESPIKLLTIVDSEEPLRTYRCFLAISERTRREQVDFFLQPHKTEIVWGGQKVLYIFQHHSGGFALYYELQASEIVAEESGGSSFPTCTIVIKNQIYIPVPNELRLKFIPAENSKKRFAIRSDLLFPE